MKKIYLDNAATTPLDDEVAETMISVMKQHYGNPSSIHQFGREARTLVEDARKTVARLLNVSPSEIFFTSGGTEANNMAIRCSISDLQLKHIITSPIEHHAVLHMAEAMEREGRIKLHFVEVDEKGRVNLQHLQQLLQENQGALVSLMHANNEIGTLLPIKKVSELCRQQNSFFHSDTVQTMGHYLYNLQEIPVDFLTCAAHKFHGPKGSGFIYINARVKINPFIYGGAQERNMRGGTENIYGIVGLAKALEIAYRDLEKDQQYITSLRDYMKERLLHEIPGVHFNGTADQHSLYTVLNVCFPATDIAEMLLFTLDIAGIAASGGSACSSGSNTGSHVLRALKADLSRPSVRFSFSKYNTREEIDYTLEKIKELFLVKA